MLSNVEGLSFNVLPERERVTLMVDIRGVRQPLFTYAFIVSRLDGWANFDFPHSLNEGIVWCRGWEGPQVDALKALHAL